VRLYAFPTDSEYTDNLAAYWTPAAAPVPGKRIDLSYTLDWTADRSPAATGMVIVENVWRGRGDQPDIARLVVDFAGVAEGSKPDLWVDIANGTLVKQAGYPVLGRKGLYRTVLDLRPNSGGVADVRLQLQAGGRAVSEYVHYPVGG